MENKGSPSTSPKKEGSEFRYLYWKAAKENKRVAEFPSVHMIVNIPSSDSNEDVWFTENDYETRETIQATIQQEINKVLTDGPPSQTHLRLLTLPYLILNLREKNALSNPFVLQTLRH